jgi:hypothetical protein
VAPALPDPKLEPVLTIPRVSKILALLLRATYALAERGDIPVIKVGPRGIRVPTAAFLNWAGITAPSAE